MAAAQRARSSLWPLGRAASRQLCGGASSSSISIGAAAGAAAARGGLLPTLHPSPLVPLSQLWRSYSGLPPHTELAMPALSPTMTQGNIAKWHVKAGDEIAPGTVLADIETDKATLAFENQEDGFVAAILKPDGARDVPVGEAVAIIVEEAGDVAAFANYTGSSSSSGAASSSNSSSSSAASAAPAAPAAPAAGGSGSFPEHVALAMPALSPTMEAGSIISWQVKEGDAVEAGTVLAEIETDKATLAFENQDDGFIARILAPAGSRDIRVGQVVAIIVEDADLIPAFASYTADGGSSSSSSAGAPAAAPPAAPAAAAAKQPGVKANFRLGPAARMALSEAGLSPDDVTPTGPHNIITKADVVAAVAAGVKPAAAAAAAAAKPAADAAAAAAAAAKPAAAAAPAKPAAAAAPPAAGSFQDIPNTQVRSIIAKRLLESKLTSPSLYVSADVGLAQLDEARKSLVAQGTKVSVNDFVLRAAALALRDVPEANAFWDAAAGAAVRQPGVDVCVAVATDGGLITPIVKGADAKSLVQISAEIKDLASRARSNKLKPEEFMGGSFSISNLGMFGLNEFSAIINPPQGAIMAVGGAQARVVVGPGGRLSSERFMTVTLSADHRLFDGPMASRLLEAFVGYMQNPLSMTM